MDLKKEKESLEVEMKLRAGSKRAKL